MLVRMKEKVTLQEFEADDDVTVEYKRENNFYYIPNSQFEVPDEINP
jgi:hypothetical protein